MAVARDSVKVTRADYTRNATGVKKTNALT